MAENYDIDLPEAQTVVKSDAILGSDKVVHGLLNDDGRGIEDEGGGGVGVESQHRKVS